MLCQHIFHDALSCRAARQQRLEAQGVPQHGDGRLSIRGSARYVAG
jgi:hypothetical protein